MVTVTFHAAQWQEANTTNVFYGLRELISSKLIPAHEDLRMIVNEDLK
jgi:hypothetical protein